MKYRYYVVVAAIVAAVLSSSASALIVDTEITYDGRTSLTNVAAPDDVIEIVAGGHIIINNRTDHDAPISLLLNGGDFTCTDSAGGYKFPDHNVAGQSGYIGVIDGTMDLAAIETFGLERNCTIEIGENGTLIVRDNYNETLDGNRWNLYNYIDDGSVYAANGYDLVVTDLGNGGVQITTARIVSRALYISPIDNAVGVPVDTDLIWTPAQCMSSQDVVLTTDPNILTNPNYITENPEMVIKTNFTGDTIPNAQLNGGNPLEPLTTYYWQIASAGGGGAGCPDAYTKDGDGLGDPWTFTTTELTVGITSQPDSEVVSPGVEAVFVVETDRANEIEWYKAGQAGALVTGGDITIEPIDVDGIGTLRISNPENNEGEYYCIVYNNLPSQLESEHAFLYIEKLLAHWKFENDLTCEVDSSNDGSESPTVPTYVSSLAAEAGNAVNLEDPNQVVLVDSSIGALPKMTVSLWVKSNERPAGGGAQISLLKGDGSDGAAVDGAVSMWFNSGNISLAVEGIETMQSYEPEGGQWYHIVGTFDSIDESRMRLYINGVLEGQVTVDEEGMAAMAVISSLTIGGWYDGFGITEELVGQIDDVRIYNYELTDLEVASLYTDWVDTTVCLGLSPAAQAVDLVEDCVINLEDFAIFAAQWLECQIVPDCEFSLP